MNKILLSRDSVIEVYQPDIDFFINKIEKGENFSFTRQLHGFWDAIIGATILYPELRKLSKNKDYLLKLSEAMVTAKNAMIPLRYSPAVYYDVLHLIINLDRQPDNFFFGSAEA